MSKTYLRINYNKQMKFSKNLIKTTSQIMLILLMTIFLIVLMIPVQPALAATISFQFGSYFLGDGAVGVPPVVITVNDPLANLNPSTIDSVQVHVTSTTDPTGITLTLTETGVNTGVFKNTNLIFMKGNYQFAVGSTTTITVIDSAADTSSTTIDQLLVKAVSSSDTTGTSFNLVETGVHTGIFTGKITFTSASSSGNNLHVANGDIFSITDTIGGLTTNGLITPNPNPSVGAIQANIGDTVTVSYNGITTTTNIGNDEAAPGGGGGGLVRPGLVLDFVAALGGFSESIFNPPSIGNDYHNKYGGGITINGKPFDVKNYTTTIEQQILDIGRPANFTLKIYDERGAYTVSHAGMYFHFKGDVAVNNADTWISWNRYKGIDIHDPNKIFNKTSVDVKADGNFFDVTFIMVPKRTMPDSSLIFRMWDDKHAVGDVPIWGAIVIVDPNAPIPVKKVVDNQYEDYAVLQKTLDQDGYNIPILLNKMHGMHYVYTSLDINWVYDKGVAKLTMAESDKSGNLLGAITCNLTKKTVQPQITDHDYFLFTTQQLNRQNETQEDHAKIAEEQKAVKILESLHIIRQNNFNP